jgi:hypothetical protein
VPVRVATGQANGFSTQLPTTGIRSRQPIRNDLCAIPIIPIVFLEPLNKSLILFGGGEFTGETKTVAIIWYFMNCCMAQYPIHRFLEVWEWAFYPAFNKMDYMIGMIAAVRCVPTNIKKDNPVRVNKSFRDNPWPGTIPYPERIDHQRGVFLESFL